MVTDNPPPLPFRPSPTLSLTNLKFFIRQTKRGQIIRLKNINGPSTQHVQQDSNQIGIPVGLPPAHRCYGNADVDAGADGDVGDGVDETRNA